MCERLLWGRFEPFITTTLSLYRFWGLNLHFGRISISETVEMVIAAQKLSFHISRNSCQLDFIWNWNFLFNNNVRILFEYSYRWWISNETVFQRKMCFPSSVGIFDCFQFWIKISLRELIVNCRRVYFVNWRPNKNRSSINWSE